eukprot:5525650-Pleurochrysis_carterae.AAC.1
MECKSPSRSSPAAPTGMASSQAVSAATGDTSNERQPSVLAHTLIALSSAARTAPRSRSSTEPWPRAHTSNHECESSKRSERRSDCVTLRTNTSKASSFQSVGRAPESRTLAPQRSSLPRRSLSSDSAAVARESAFRKGWFASKLTKKPTLRSAWLLAARAHSNGSRESVDRSAAEVVRGSASRLRRSPGEISSSAPLVKNVESTSISGPSPASPQRRVASCALSALARSTCIVTCSRSRGPGHRLGRHQQRAVHVRDGEAVCQGAHVALVSSRALRQRHAAPLVRGRERCRRQARAVQHGDGARHARVRPRGTPPEEGVEVSARAQLQRRVAQSAVRAKRQEKVCLIRGRQGCAAEGERARKRGVRGRRAPRRVPERPSRAACRFCRHRVGHVAHGHRFARRV